MFYGKRVTVSCGKIDSSRYKDYILSMLFVKYLSDLNKERRFRYADHFAGDQQRIDRAMSREPFVIDDESSFDYLYENRSNTQIGQKINIALSDIEERNGSKLRNVFRAIDFNSTVDLGEPREKNAILKNLLEDFHELDLSPSQLNSSDIIGDAYEYMIANFASNRLEKGGEFFTHSRVSELVAKLVQPHENDRIYDATFEEIRENDFNLNIPRYVDTFEEEEQIDIETVKSEIKSIEAELTEVQAQMDNMKELGI
jgi:type I restriction enzyme M protein